MLLLTPLAWGFVLIYGKKRVVFRVCQPEILNRTSLITIFVHVLRALVPTLYTCILVIIVRSFLNLRAMVLAFSLRLETSLAIAFNLTPHHTYVFRVYDGFFGYGKYVSYRSYTCSFEQYQFLQPWLLLSKQYGSDSTSVLSSNARM
ncbi:hypothetical protein BPAE_0102g00120 [Botrytis paeoniae]|uniref:Uncharacterized protein n=1 Tax=Botrytis paeoniae TaxID=278948 RepID=A0A4Z1FLM7_9HELO|nr:hypothetical protein BPAE_0102g00120 [Botrytis paeoniae]